MNSYRRDIDGLRGVSIILVCLFHLNLDWIKGGFVGVDVFFVISGYVITSLIIRMIEKDTFSFKGFYVRRIRRLYPALIFTLSFTILLGFFYLSPEHLKRMSGALISSIFGLSNFYFLGEVGYFDAAAKFKPLLHTWSLAIEEQFYLFWPAVLLFILSAKRIRYRPYLYLSLHVAALVSLGMSMVFYNSVSSFFFTPFRAYELYIGCVLALRPAPVLSNLRKEVLFLVGSISIIFSAFFLSIFTNNASIFSFLASSGSALIIISGNPKIFGVVVRNNIMVFFGKISYSLYLIHWPLFVFIGYYYFSDIKNYAIEAMFISISIATLMYFYVERPFRYKETSFFYRNARSIFLVSIGILSFVSVHAFLYEGWRWRFSQSAFFNIDEYVRMSRSLSDKNLSDANPRSVEDWKKYKKNVVILGDSHSEDLFNALTLVDSNVKEFNFRRDRLTEDCIKNLGSDSSTMFRVLSIVGIIKDDMADTEACISQRNSIKNSKFIEKADIIILANEVPNTNYGRFSEYIKFVKGVSSAEVIVFGTNFLPYDPPTMALVKSNEKELNKYMYNLDRNNHRNNNKALSDIANTHGVSFFNYYPLMCRNKSQECIIVKNGTLLFEDDNHWSYDGEKFYGRLITEAGILAGINSGFR